MSVNRRNQKNKPKRGLGQAVTRQRRKAAEAAREQEEQRIAREKQAALDELKRAEQVFKESEEVQQRKFANSLFKSIVAGQTAVLRAWGMDHGVKCRTHMDDGVAAWTDFTDVHCYWPEKDIPNRDNFTAVADVIAQIKGVMQHEFGHLRFTTSWYEVNQNAKYPRRHRGDEHHMMTCWNMLEDERMETLVVDRVPRIGRYFGTMVANVILGDTDVRQTWLMLAGREYLPYEVLEASYDVFDAWAEGQGIKGAADTWYDLVQDYKAASTHQQIMDAVANAYDFIKKLGATIPDTVDTHDQHDENETGNDPADSAGQRGSILDMFKDRESKGGKSKKSDKPQPPKEQKKSDKPGPNGEQAKKGDDSDQDGEGQGQGQSGDEDGEDEGQGSGQGDEGDEQGDEGAGDSGQGTREDANDASGNGADSDHHGSDNIKDAQDSDRDEDFVPGQTNSGDGSHQRQNEEEDLHDALTDMRDNFQESIRNDADVMEMQWNAQDMSDGEGLPEYDGGGTTPMSDELVANAEGVALGIKEALNSFLTESAPYWQNHQEDGVVDPLAYRTKQPGERTFRRQLVGEQNQGLDVHVSMLCDVSYSMSGGYGSVVSPIQALSEALYATALACDELGIGRTLTLWSSGREYYSVHSDGKEPEPVIFPAMGGTDPTPALDDLVNHNPEGASNHLVIIFTDGAWGGHFPSLQRWGGEGRRIVLVRYGRYEGEVQTDMGADEHIYIDNVSALPEKLTWGLLDVLASGDL